MPNVDLVRKSRLRLQRRVHAQVEWLEHEKHVITKLESNELFTNTLFQVTLV